jgi:hypothetical protein
MRSAAQLLCSYLCYKQMHLRGQLFESEMEEISLSVRELDLESP